MQIAIRSLVLVTCFTSGVAAQPYEPVPPPAAPERHGLFAGGGLWGGEISCDGMDCGGFREAGGAGLQIGYLLSPRLALLSDTWVMTSSQNSVSVTFVTSTLGARAWLTPALWIQGGVGIGHAKVTWGPFTTAMSDDVPVASAAVGYEIIRGRKWALDVSLKVAQGSKTDNEGNAVSTGRQSGIGVNFVGFLQ
jgi:hypothetical protein